MESASSALANREWVGNAALFSVKFAVGSCGAGVSVDAINLRIPLSAKQHDLEA
jgi:hypothetical protein